MNIIKRWLLILPVFALVFCLAIPALAVDDEYRISVSDGGAMTDFSLPLGRYELTYYADDVILEFGVIDIDSYDTCYGPKSGSHIIEICLFNGYFEILAPRDYPNGTVVFVSVSNDSESGNLSITSAITGVWGVFASWIVARLADMQAVFWVATETGGSLSLLGVLAVAALGIGFVFLLIGVIQHFIKLRS